MNHVPAIHQMRIECISNGGNMNHIPIIQYILDEFSFYIRKLIFEFLQFDSDRIKDKYELILNRK